ncbi:MAG: DUF5615 family PIN-like protein [Nitrospirae bacterium]|nr:DUF5615 family PIN-like protein [Nitrospirota bacterium]
MKFIVDVCAGKSISEWLVGKGHDVLNVVDINPKMSDDGILDIAVQESRIVVTNDTDFQEMFYLLGKEHKGIIRLPNVDKTRRLELMQQILDRFSDDLSNNAIVTVKRNKIRISREPAR